MRKFYLKHEQFINLLLAFLLIIICGVVSYLTAYHSPLWIGIGIVGVPGFLFLMAKCDDISYINECKEEKNKNE